MWPKPSQLWQNFGNLSYMNKPQYSSVKETPNFMSLQRGWVTSTLILILKNFQCSLSTSLNWMWPHGKLKFQICLAITSEHAYCGSFHIWTQNSVYRNMSSQFDNIGFHGEIMTGWFSISMDPCPAPLSMSLFEVKNTWKILVSTLQILKNCRSYAMWKMFLIPNRLYSFSAIILAQQLLIYSYFPSFKVFHGDPQNNIFISM